MKNTTIMTLFIALTITVLMIGTYVLKSVEDNESLVNLIKQINSSAEKIDKDLFMGCSRDEELILAKNKLIEAKMWTQRYYDRITCAHLNKLKRDRKD